MNRTSSIALSSLFLLTGCATSLGWHWSEPQFLQAPPQSKYAGHRAVYLLMERRYLLHGYMKKDSYTEIQVHDVIAVLNEKGYDFADVRVIYPDKDSTIEAFSARTINADGSVTEIEPAWVFDDEVQDGERGFKVRVFTFPDVKVGSVLEYQYALRWDDLQSTMSPSLVTDVPIEKFHLELMGTDIVKYMVNAYNVGDDARWETTEDGDYWRLSWTMDDIPARRSPEHAVPDEFREPWWMYTVLAYQSSYGAIWVHRDWSETMKYPAAKLYDDEDYYDGFTDQVDVADCADRRCRIERALVHLRDTYPFDWFGSGLGRSAQEVVDSKRADNFEKARLLYELLRRASVTSQFAFTNRVGRVNLDRDQPHFSRLHHLVLYVPAQEGIDAPIWIDPSCEFCRLGQIPPWLVGQDALVVWPELEGLSTKAKYATEWRPIQGGSATPTRIVTTYAVTIDDNGAMSAELEDVRHGDEALWWFYAHRDDEARTITRQAENEVSARHETGRVTSAPPAVFADDRARSTRVVRYTVPDYAVRDKERLLVPLSLFRTTWDSSFLSAGRRDDLYFSRFAEWIERAVIRGPQGYAPTSALAPQKIDCGAFLIEIDSEVQGDALVVTRRLVQRPGRRRAADYPKIRAAFEAYRSVHRGGIVLERAERSSSPSASR